MTPPLQRLLRLSVAFLFLITPSFAGDLESALERAGENRAELEAAIERVPEDEREGMRWLIAHMPEVDLTSLSADYLVENHRLAYESWNSAPWRETVDAPIFLDAVLPYASVNERRDAWRAELRKRCLPLVEEAKSASEAAALLNNAIWKEFNVKYSTQRKKPDQSPFETLESGLASCTGLSVLLIDSCRSVGVPARFVGTPLWSDDSGNHSWVEIWDDGWHFTGAAEPSGMELNKGWFAGRAAGAKRDDPKYAIYATTWRDTPISFPLVWLPGDDSVNAVNVSDRYTSGAQVVPAGSCVVRLRVIDEATGERKSVPVVVRNSRNEFVFEGQSKDERFDANDHLEVLLELGGGYTATIGNGDDSVDVSFIAESEALATLILPIPLDEALEVAGPITRERATQYARELWEQRASRVREARAEELASRVLVDGELKMPIWYKAYGVAPKSGRSLYISMHGGGGAPTVVNDRQWENQKGLYQPQEGIYLAPRAATDTWNLWHQAHIDTFFDRLIQDLIVLEDVNPDRVYLMGYSAGGDGVYQLAPRMADRFAAVAMMAGHPNETKPDGLRNLPFTLHMGSEDGAYDRNKIALEWGAKFTDLAKSDKGGYAHHVEIHEGKGHWMDRNDAVALPWMAKHTRNLRPERIVWLQDDVTHERFYWLRNPEPKARERIVVERDGQTITIVEAPAGTTLELRLDDSMLDLDEALVVRCGDAELFRGSVPRTVATLVKTLEERGDPRGMFCAEVSVTTP